MSPERRAALDRAYRAALYQVQLPGAVLTLRIGPPDGAAEARLVAAAGCRRGWALVTPCNPWSEPLDDAENLRLYNALKDELAALSQPWLPSLHRDPAGVWPDEPGCLLLDPPPGLAVELGRRYRQNAVVTAELGQTSRLIWLDDAAL